MDNFELTDEMRKILDERTDEIQVYITAEESVDKLRRKYIQNIPDWQVIEVNQRTKEYLNNPSISLDFESAMDDIKNQL